MFLRAASECRKRDSVAWQNSVGTSFEVVHAADVLPTLADFVGVPITKVDGRSIKDALMHNKPLPERAIVVANFDNEALIEWPWSRPRRIVAHDPRLSKSGVFGYLYNIESDPGELEDVQTQYPQHFARLRDALLAMPRRRSVEFTTDQAWDTFGGEETRAPWAESAKHHQGN